MSRANILLTAATVAVIGAIANPAIGQPTPSEPDCDGPSCKAVAIDELSESDARLVDLGLKTESASERSGLSTIGWGVLAFPGDVVEGALLPVLHLISVTQRYHLIDRVGALLKITDRLSYVPKAKAATGFGFGFGAKLKYDWGDVTQREMSVNGLYNVNTDYKLGVGLSQRLASLEGRRFHIEVEHEVDQGEKYFGLGGKTTLSDERELGMDSSTVVLEGEISPRGLEAFSGIGRLGFRRERLYPGSGSQPPVGEMGDDVEPPPGFGETTSYISALFNVRYDRRDTAGRTSKGTVTEFNLGVTSDVHERNLTAVSADATAKLYVPVLGRERRLVFLAGVGIAESVFSDHQVPLHAMVVLGRRNGSLRGYTSERFRSTRGWWSSTEYHYPIWYFDEKPVTVNTILFFDVGGSGNSVAELIESDPLYSYGAGFSIEAYALALASFQFGRSPEGSEFIFGAGIDI